MHPREGLVLQTVGYEDDRRVRPILYRAALSEMVVPYGDTDRNWRWRSAFDVGEYGMGRLASSIEPKMDAPSNATLIDVTYAGDDGKPYVLPRAVGIYERDGGLLWKHYESYSETNESRRARELVIFFIATIGNYDYSINWIFHQDGVLELHAGLTGIMLPRGVGDANAGGHGGGARSGHLVSANVIAPHHQHFLNFRLDFDVDGENNSVHEMNTRALPAGPRNPGLNGIVMEETVLATEAAAERQLNMPSARTWAIVGAERDRTSHELHSRARRERDALRGDGLTGATTRGLHQSSFSGRRATRQTRCMPPVLTPTRASAATAFPGGWPTTSGSPIGMSSSGTRWALPTFRDRKSGR
jgi:primary-amine oxidase